VGCSSLGQSDRFGPRDPVVWEASSREAPCEPDHGPEGLQGSAERVRWANQRQQLAPRRSDGERPTVQRLFAGTPWDRPATCERCGQPETACQCPRPLPEPARLDTSTQTARLRKEKRARGKLVTLVAGLDAQGNDLPGLAATLKAHCGAGGTVKSGLIELQGDHLDAAEAALKAIGYQTRRG
jgi:translation initiation factor 1